MPPVSESVAGPLALIVMGVSGCGKSTIGALLGIALAAPFLEGDDFHSEAAIAKMRAGRPLTDEDRWPWLDRIAGAADAAVSADGAAVIACSALRAAYRTRLRSAISAPVRFVFLDNGRERLLARLAARPDHYMPATLLDSQLATLERPGPDEDVMTLTTDAPPAELCDAALGWLR